ncbi:MAG TPA: hypothetical protein V6D28_09625 [Leptolyngbyaceae cyanobacterium]
MSTTYLKIYGISSTYSEGIFVHIEDLIIGDWATTDDGNYIEIGGRWANENATEENYFVANSINGNIKAPEELHKELISIGKAFMLRKYKKNVENIVYFAGNLSLGYEYPILNTSEENNISVDKDIFNYSQILRYAFASSYVYSLEENTEPCSFEKNPIFLELMKPQGADKIDIVYQIKNKSDNFYAVAIKVPKVNQRKLEEEIIIAFKGTSNRRDLYTDFYLAVQRFYNSRFQWEELAYNFVQKVIGNYAPHNNCIQQGYVQYNGTYPIVLTGHSLGGYIAKQMNVRTGITTRVFSAPTTFKLRDWFRFYQNKLYRNSCINFIRNSDIIIYPVLTNNEENMVFFPSTSNVVNNHKIDLFIETIFLPLVSSESKVSLTPTGLYIKPSSTLGSGQKFPVNKWRSEKLDLPLDVKIPVGTIIDWWIPDVSTLIPPGFLLCNGQKIEDIESPWYGKNVPDLTNLFVKCVTDLSQVGQVDGQEFVSPIVCITENTGQHKHNLPPVTGIISNDDTPIPIDPTVGTSYYTRDDHKGWSNKVHIRVDDGGTDQYNEGHHRHIIGGQTADTKEGHSHPLEIKDINITPKCMKLVKLIRIK